jgi:hypothetical protein
MMAMNMRDCRFQNTLKALQECQDDMYLNEDTMFEEELKAKDELIKLCKEIVEEWVEE